MTQMAVADIRAARESDRDPWLRMRVALWPDGSEIEHRHEVETYFGSALPEPQAVLLAFAASGDAVGFAELSIRPCAEGCSTTRVAYLEGWYVVPEARRRGVGRALIAACEAWGREHGCVEFASDTQPDNVVSRRAHEAAGFEEAGLILCFRKLIA